MHPGGPLRSSEGEPSHYPKRRRLFKARDLPQRLDAPLAAEGSRPSVVTQVTGSSSQPSQRPPPPANAFRALTRPSVPNGEPSAAVPAANGCPPAPGNDLDSASTEATSSSSDASFPADSMLGDAAAEADGQTSVPNEVELSDDEQEDVIRANDTICLACDNGGDVIQCDGACNAVFHFGKCHERGFIKGFCNPLQMPQKLAERCFADNIPWTCPSCFASVHQCYVCKQEGRAEASGGPQEVFRCTITSCGRFYHPGCIGLSAAACSAIFKCPLHTCGRCKQGPKYELRHKGELLPCRRCPTAYHQQRGCMPPEITKENGRLWLNNRDDDGNIIPSDDSIEMDIVYCMRHDLTQDIPPHTRPLIRQDLLESWHLHMARTYPELDCSRHLLREHERACDAVEDVPLMQRLHSAPQKPERQHSAVEEPRRAPERHREAAPGRPPSAQRPTRPPQPSLQAADEAEDIPLMQRMKAQPRASASTPKPRPVSRNPSPGVAVRVQVTEQHKATAAGTHALDTPTGRADATSAKARTSRVTEVSLSAVCTEPPAELHGPGRPAEAAAVRISTTSVASDERVSASMPPMPPALPGAGAGTEMPGPSAMQVDVTQEATAVSSAAGITGAPPQLPLPPRIVREPFEEEAMLRSTSSQQRVASMFADAAKARTYTTVLESTWRPEPYTNPCINSVEPSQLAIWKHGLSGAQQALAANNQNEAMHQWMSLRSLQAIMQREDMMRITLAPFLHCNRYTSYGRHFTVTDQLLKLNRQLVNFMEDDDTIVDFSCGANEWLPLLKEACAKRQLRCHGKAFDIITPIRVDDFTRVSWFDVLPGTLASDPDKLVIGLNPPFGTRNALADKFTEHAARSRPRLIALIVPPGTKLPAGYRVVYEDHDTMKDKSFRIPGVGDSWNKVAPCIRLLARNDALKRVAPRTPEFLHRHLVIPPEGLRPAGFPPTGHLPPLNGIDSRMAVGHNNMGHPRPSPGGYQGPFY